MFKAMENANGVNGTNGVEAPPPPAAAKAKKKTVEATYQKKTQLEHILLRPDSYIGSVEKVTENMWVFDSVEEKFVLREITYVPGLYKIFDEILVNAADNKQRDPNMNTIKIDINPAENTISVYNNGHGIPVEMHKDEKMYVPTMIFGHLLTSSNYDDTEKKVTGGRNGYGAKLCNIFSTKFTVETATKESKRTFKQVWGANMSKASDPKVKDFSGEEFTKITFSPDLVKFKMDVLDADIVDLFNRRAYDIAASCTGIKVFLNGKRVPVKNFKDYVNLYVKDQTDIGGNPVKVVHERHSERWEYAVTISDSGFQHMSFVNSIATNKGGRHVDYITNMVMNKLSEKLNKGNKTGDKIKPFQVKHYMWVFVNCLIENPTFDSQTKDTMTLVQKNFGSKCELSPTFATQVLKSGIVEAVLSQAKFAQQQKLARKCDGKKTNKLKGIPKLEDANDAGTKSSSDCTLILTEGDSAKTLAVAGLGIVGRDKYGVFPLRGKLLNTREATMKQIMENAEINNIIKIVGLQYKKKYDSIDDLKTLRYGKMMIMTDQDQDGSHIKGLLINFIHHNWPSLLRLPFLEEFITPIVKATKAKQVFSFYSLPEFEEWKEATDNWHTYKIKYYKGLGTSTSVEAKEYFSDMLRHRIRFKHEGPQDDHSITMAFSKKAIEQRKEWLTKWMEECKERKVLGLPEVYLYEKDTRFVNYSDFVNKELVLFSNADNERSIPSIVDGLKPGQRKVVFTCLKRNDKKEVKVAQLAGSIAEHTAYHHGEVSLMSTITNLAQNFVGSNNINILQPIGQFGTRLMGGKDSASPRYIFTKLSPMAKQIFHPSDEPLLNYLKEDNQNIEPEWFMPILPMILVNGADGIGTGWSTKVPNFNPRDIMDNLKRLIAGEEPVEMTPWYKNFKGTIEQLDTLHYISHGEVSQLTDTKYEITELPIKTWTQAYKEGVMENLLGGEKIPATISDYKEYNTDTTIRFVVNVLDSKADHVREEGPHKIFKLQSSMSLNSMVLFDANGVLRRYDDPLQILKEFYELRLSFYVKRKAHMIGLLEAEALKLSNQARFIKEKCDGTLVIENKKKKAMIEELVTKGYESDPIKAWKKAHEKKSETAEDEDSDAEEEDSGQDFDYLLGMPMWNLTKEKKDEMLRKEQEKKTELKTVQGTSEQQMWTTDLDELRTKLDTVEEEERQEAKGDTKIMAKGKTGGKQRKKMMAAEVLPSPAGTRIMPAIDAEMRKKREKLENAKKNVGKRKLKQSLDAAAEGEGPDEFDTLASGNASKKGLAARLGNSPAKVLAKAKANKDGTKQTKLSFAKKKRASWQSDQSSDDDDAGSDLSVDVDVAPRERAAGRRAAASKAKFKFDDSSSESDGELSLHSNDGVDEANEGPEKASFLEDSVVEAPKAKTAPRSVDVSDSDSDFGAPPKAASPPKPSAEDMFDSLVESPKKSAAKRPIADSSDDDAVPVAKKAKAAPKKPAAKKAPAAKKPAAPKKAPAAKKAPPKKRKNFDDSCSGEDSDVVPGSPVAPRATTGRARKPATYKLDDSDNSDSDF